MIGKNAAFVLLFELAFLATAVSAQDAVKCQECHDEPVNASVLGAPQEELAKSIHASLSCADCHTAFSADRLDTSAANPHAGVKDEIGCAGCHSEEVEVYQKHGRLRVGVDPDLPTCWSCHGTHEILPAADRQSHVHPINLPSTCRACHTNVDLVKKHATLREEPIRLYENSVHGQASKKGLYVSATCNDCHSATDPNGKRTAHRILSPADPESTIFHFNIPDTCGRCHKYVTQDYWEGIHGQFVKRGSVDAPVCTNCHGEHGIVSKGDPTSPVSTARLAEQTCAPCHESAVLNEKYGVPGGRLASYIDSYHGLKSKAGDVTVANCASCHGSHRILPSMDPTSSINPANLRATCGECHPKITAELAQTKIHETATGLHAGWPNFFRKLYLVLIAATIGGMLLHNAADWLRHVRLLGKRPFVQRLSTGEVAQHWVLMLSFTVLVITGFSLRFSEAAWVKFLFGWKGGFEIRGVIHRVAAVVMVLGAVWHLVYLFTHRGRHWFRDMCVSLSDFTHAKQNLVYFLGFREHEPKFKRFSYMEKAEYWALVWGTLIMSGTGLMLWFDNYFVDHWNLPKGILDVALVIHYYEAWLAFLAILVWHIYGTMLKPKVYPMNPSWISGRMPKDMYSHEHPEGPKLKARTIRVPLEEEQEDEEDQGATGPAEISDGEGNGRGTGCRSAPRAAQAVTAVSTDSSSP